MQMPNKYDRYSKICALHLISSSQTTGFCHDLHIKISKTYTLNALEGWRISSGNFRGDWPTGTSIDLGCGNKSLIRAMPFLRNSLNPFNPFNLKIFLYLHSDECQMQTVWVLVHPLFRLLVFFLLLKFDAKQANHWVLLLVDPLVLLLTLLEVD